jgi:REP-associated tyrosine transposase
MTNYRRNFVSGGSYFFTVNLADRRLQIADSEFDGFCKGSTHPTEIRRA